MYKRQVQSKIDMLNERLLNKVKEEFLGKGVKYTESERKAITRAYRSRYGARMRIRSILHFCILKIVILIKINM